MKIKRTALVYLAALAFFTWVGYEICKDTCKTAVGYGTKAFRGKNKGTK